MVQSFLPVQMRQNAPKIYYIGDKNDFLWAGQPPKPQPTAYGAAPPPPLYWNPKYASGSDCPVTSYTGAVDLNYTMPLGGRRVVHLRSVCHLSWQPSTAMFSPPSSCRKIWNRTTYIIRAWQCETAGMSSTGSGHMLPRTFLLPPSPSADLHWTPFSGIK